MLFLKNKGKIISWVKLYTIITKAYMIHTCPSGENHIKILKNNVIHMNKRIGTFM